MGYNISKDQSTRIWQWYNSHDCEKEFTHPFTGSKHKGGLEICFGISSGIGTTTIGRCACGESIDVTDYDSW